MNNDQGFWSVISEELLKGIEKAWALIEPDLGYWLGFCFFGALVIHLVYIRPRDRKIDRLKAEAEVLRAQAANHASTQNALQRQHAAALTPLQQRIAKQEQELAKQEQELAKQEQELVKLKEVSAQLPSVLQAVTQAQAEATEARRALVASQAEVAQIKNVAEQLKAAHPSDEAALSKLFAELKIKH